MSTAQVNGNETRSPIRLAAAVLFVLVVGMGYAITPQGAVDVPNAAEDQDTAEPPYFPAGCRVDGLTFSECMLDF